MENNEGMQEVRLLSDAIIRFSEELLELLPIGAVQLPIKGTDKYVFAGTLAMIAQVLPKDAVPPVTEAEQPTGDLAPKIMGSIMSNLHDRSGVFSDIDDDIMDEIRAEMQETIAAHLARQSPAPEPVEVAQEVTQQAAKADEQVPGIPYPTTHADLARITPLQLWQRWVPQDRAITAREAFIAARNIPFVIAPTTSTVSASGADGSAA